MIVETIEDENAKCVIHFAPTVGTWFGDHKDVIQELERYVAIGESYDITYVGYTPFALVITFKDGVAPINKAIELQRHIQSDGDDAYKPWMNCYQTGISDEDKEKVDRLVKKYIDRAIELEGKYFGDVMKKYYESAKDVLKRDVDAIVNNTKALESRFNNLP